MKNVRVLVTGATGYVGSRLVSALVDAGADVVVASRTPDRLRTFGWYDDVTSVALDAQQPQSVRQALAEAGSVDVIYYLVHAIGQPDFRDTDNRAATNVAEAAREAGVARIVYLGGFVPTDETLSEHLAGRAEVAEALTVPDGPDVVWLGAAIIIGAGSTSFEMLRYVADRFLVLPMPKWAANPIDPISIRDALHYLVAAADTEKVPAGAYDIHGPETTTYGELLQKYARLAGRKRAPLPVRGIDTSLVSQLSGLVLPVPGGLAGDLIESLDHPMTASKDGLRDLVDDPAGGLTGVDEAIRRSLSPQRPRPVNRLVDVHHLADTDPVWAGGDNERITRLVRPVTPSIARPALGLLGLVPGPVAAAMRTGLDTLVNLVPKGKPA
ncbi:NAD-dependent epimerase [Mycobacterium sp. IS-1742]|uniref:NAD(P)H-binding protein n=1 Tax=Mycobacterium sp. IS-1742 TaxID=1772285 RepID=UPI00073FDF2A|nr:NAD(P)H-binding protein [Mycobacterium sp. IS-1742]KUI30651.1 NAD-dependent epimerase [Mycobacterium sp. IS-1742]